MQIRRKFGIRVANNDALPTEILRYGVYVCVRVHRDKRDTIASVAASELAEQLGFSEWIEPRVEHPSEAVAFLRRIDATPGDIADEDLLQANAIIHVASQTARPVAEFCKEIEQRLGPAMKPLILRGVTRPMSYTGTAMHNFAYAHQVTQQPGPTWHGRWVETWREVFD